MLLVPPNININTTIRTNIGDTMEINGLFATVHMPEALKGDSLHSLPPGYPITSYLVDDYDCPKHWQHGSALSSSYFVGLKAGRGMWFDFTSNMHHQHDVAVVVSVQGINPVTGKPITKLNLEQYRTKCPIHNIDFGQDRWCEKCGHKWSAQNYIATTTGQYLWIDGFVNDKGEVVQYIITEDMTRGIAAQVIGEARTWSIGFAFYLSKAPKPSLIRTSSMGFGYSNSVSKLQKKYLAGASSGLDHINSMCQPYNAIYSSADTQPEPVTHNCSFDPSSTPVASSGLEYTSAGVDNVLRASRPRSLKRHETPPKVLEIGGGARIKQDIGVDRHPIDYWSDEPAGMIYVNYTDEETVARILQKGKLHRPGPMAGLKIGN